MTEAAITPEMPVEQVMRDWPATVPVFVRRHMHCVGCAVSPFHSVAEASAEYRLSLPDLLAELKAAAGTP
ncbi:DUF1858 domain-containing protein [Muricoccus pecuniae]|uniref:Hybrid cluster-associated redox disulfide protein n=1 Tax=Muricoccus pecuniae TaxID=693023 RepID=A0A840XYN7_9PROT|nr:DUF1858 domain-containing protein [Roseomonas pecuniae]MBB5692370.1 hybrid cluster-associated redox disulfide protein [Roseomonas pecuniae]